MNVFMLKHRDRDDWFINKKKGRKNVWTNTQSKATIWTSKRGLFSAINYHELKGMVDIVEFELKQLVVDPK